MIENVLTGSGDEFSCATADRNGYGTAYPCLDGGYAGLFFSRIPHTTDVD